MRVTVDGALSFGVTAKDLILALIGIIGTAGGTGHVIEYAGSAIRWPHHGRPHDRVEHVDRGGRARRADRAGRRDLRLSQGPAAGAAVRRLGPGRRRLADAAVGPGAAYDCEVALDAAGIAPQVTWGTSPQDVVAIGGAVPDPADEADDSRRAAMERQPRLHGPRKPA